MIIASSLGDFLWSLLVIFFMVCYFMILFRVIIDVFRRRDASGWNKALWLLFIFFLPLIGPLTYLIVHAGDMADRDMRDVQQSQQAFDDYVRNVAGSGGAASEITQAKQLLDSGAITETEFEAIKTKALAT
jgi:predicted PurR-regulated permease PerM